MTLLLSRLWQALAELSQQSTERLDWQSRLGDEWAVAKRLLTSTGAVAHAIACPSQSHDECPRRVVHHSDGRIVAVCGNRPAICEEVVLQADDIEILQLDTAKLAHLLAELLDLQPWHSPITNRTLVPLGDVSLQFTYCAPVLLGFPSYEQPLSSLDVPTLAPGERPGVILVPRSIDSTVLAEWPVISLERVVGVDETGSFALLPSGKQMLEDLRKRSASAMVPADETVWPLPRDATWEELLFHRTAEDRLLVSFRGTTKDFDAFGLKMIDSRNNEPSRSWLALGWFIEAGGQLSIADLAKRTPSGTKKGGSVSLGTFRKLKQKLADDLQNRFGLKQEPIHPAGPQTYKAIFRVRNSDPRDAPARHVL